MLYYAWHAEIIEKMKAGPGWPTQGGSIYSCFHFYWGEAALHYQCIHSKIIVNCICI